jgi:hypothetical protein
MARYQDVALYEASRPRHAIAKTLRAYGLTNSIRRVKDAASYLDCCERGEIADPFWAVAGNQTSPST